ncbi:MAG: heparan-alpha-glucosaminide N-acetyltransferase domain-containing protein [Bacteroidota bacterium]
MQTRLLSLDIFRGITVAFMIIVNNPGDWGHLYWPLEHAAWHGCTPTDLVFPFFLFIVGVSIPFADQTKAGDLLPNKYKKLLLRTLKLFCLGLFLSLFPKFNFETVRIMGVLQRIALVYAICSVLYLNLSEKYLILTFACCLLGYYFIMTFVPVPGFGNPNLEPETNFGAWFDRTILTEPHLWKTAKTWDPEGLLGTIPAVGNGILGILAGKCLLRVNLSAFEKTKWLFFTGIVLAAAGMFWNYAGFPINKSLWTSSFTLFTSGLASIFLSILYYLIDYKGIKQYTNFFVVFGVNAILAFFLSGLIPRILGMIKLKSADEELISSSQWIYLNWISPLFSNPKNASLAGAITFLLILYVPFYWMWKKKFFVKV